MTMAEAHATMGARVVAIWRYSVKSMMGEELNATEVTEHGLLGDRAFALIDEETGKTASAKNPRRSPPRRSDGITAQGVRQRLRAAGLPLPDRWLTTRHRGR